MCKKLFRVAAAVTLLIALCVIGYRRGYRKGHEREAPPAVSNALIVKTYPVADLVTPIGVKAAEGKRDGSKLVAKEADFDELIELIVSTIEHDSWMENGTGEGEIQPFPSNHSLIISQTQRVHEQIADLLEQLRTLSTTIEAKDVIPYMQSVAANGKGASHPFRIIQGDAKGRDAINKLFAKAVRNLSYLWGSPEFYGERSADGGHDWSNADRLACWPRAGGVAYLGVKYDFEMEHKLLVGWQPTE